MASIKKLPSPGSSQDFASSDYCSGNNKWENPKPVNWPYQGFTTDNEVSPQDNKFPVPQLSNNPAIFSDTGVKSGTANKQTLG